MCQLVDSNRRSILNRRSFLGLGAAATAAATGDQDQDEGESREQESHGAIREAKPITPLPLRPAA